MSRKLTFCTAAVVALATCGWCLPGGAAAADRLPTRDARAAARTAVQPVAASLTGDAVTRISWCRRRSARRVVCRVTVSAAPSYRCRVTVVIRQRGRRVSTEIGDMSCVG